MGGKHYSPVNQNRISLRKRLQRLLGWVLVIGGMIGLIYTAFLKSKDFPSQYSLQKERNL